MSGREVDLDALFDRDADSRLLDRRRHVELGLAPHAPPGSSTPVSFGAESIVDENPPAPKRRAAMLRVGLDARPKAELIPGAVVTVVVSVHDEGDEDAGDVRLRLALPGDAEPIPGTFARDEIELDGEALIGEGLRIGTVPAAGIVRVRFAVRILPGTEPLDVIAHVTAPGVPTIAAPALRLRRRTGHAAYEPPRPFYELEAGEAADDDLLSPAERFHAVDTVADEPLVPAVEPEPVLAHEPEPEAIVVPEPEPEPEAIVVPEPEPEAIVEPEPVAAEYVLGRALDEDEVRAIERVFSGAVPHGLAALATLSAIACTGGPLGDALGLGAFARGISAAMPRALVAARIARPTPPVVTREALEAIRADAAAPDQVFVHDGPALIARLEPRELDALRALLARDLADTFLRGVQVLLAVVPRELAGVEPAAAERVGDALAAYRAASGAWLMRVTVRRAVDKRYDPLTAADSTLHDAGRALVTVLREAVAP
jgi:hypothetical protein